MTDLAGNITFLNPTAEGITGWSGEDARGRPLKEVFHIRDRDGSEADALPVGVSGQGGRSVVLMKKSGEAILIEDNTAPIRDDTGGLTGLVVVFRERARRSAKDGDGVDEGKEGEHLARMVESIVDPLFTMDSAWRTLPVSGPFMGRICPVDGESAPVHSPLY